MSEDGQLERPVGVTVGAFFCGMPNKQGCAVEMTDALFLACPKEKPAKSFSHGGLPAEETEKSCIFTILWR
ncbi:hypothetical protein [uncultured Bilophila sp.]|uniref:hypothetical protein n=1 Tax=uncultured Bilophila sp. TaxID=529385 RepID=UPI00280B3E79|nr:hypothetical protein [uncultured Bilophila sp.]